MKSFNEQMEEMSNLITDMIIAGASVFELSRAIDYSEMIIDCERSRINNDIDGLRNKYQPK